MHTGRQVISVWAGLGKQKLKFKAVKAISMRGNKIPERRKCRDISLKRIYFSFETFASP